MFFQTHGVSGALIALSHVISFSDLSGRLARIALAVGCKPASSVAFLLIKPTFVKIAVIGRIADCARKKAPEALPHARAANGVERGSG